jgi:ABC-type multidrug transport system ATPase subunit
LCQGNSNVKEIATQTLKTLSDLGLQDARNIKVGSPLNKTISGGQRKRLNIALELLREPPVLFVDEPTSGLSSKDSENVMDLLKELTLKGKQIFVVIHQPSSDIYKMFDKVIVLDKGGYQIYYGNPIEAVMHFKNAAHHLNSDIGECESCGNVNPEIMFNIIEAKEVDEYGNSTENRKVLPHQWADLYKEKEIATTEINKDSIPATSFSRPSKIKQFFTFLKRDLFSKLSNTQYLLINLLEAPLLAFVLAGLIKYYDSSEGAVYVFRENENIPAYIFISVLVMLFLGLTVSAEEIFRDQKILKREKFLNLSRSSYLFSKISLLFFISAIQAISFVCIGNAIVGIKGMTTDYFLVLFSVASFANIIGLNISSAFNSAVTIYIIIPLLIIPQMILGGAMISYDKINKYFGGGEKVPMIAEFMITRWAYEALMVNQFTKNKYEKEFYFLDKKISQANYLTAYYFPELSKMNAESKKYFLEAKNIKKLEINREIITNELKKFPLTENEVLKKNVKGSLSIAEFDRNEERIKILNGNYSDTFNYWDEKKEKLIQSLEKINSVEKMNRIKDNYSNDNLSDILFRSFAKKKIIPGNGELIQVMNPVFKNVSDTGLATFNEPLFVAEKRINKFKISTLTFNIIITWLFSVIGFIALYFDWLKKVLSIKRPRFKKTQI